MRPLRWNRRYLTGDAEADRRHRAFVDCPNCLIKAAGQREHCEAMKELISRFGADVQVDQVLQARPADGNLGAGFGLRLRDSLPLSLYRTTACRPCGLFVPAQQKITEHVEVPAQCLFKRP